MSDYEPRPETCRPADWLAYWAGRMPTHAAVVASAKLLTYSEMSERVSMVRGLLLRRGVGQGSLVVLCTASKLDFMVGLAAATSLNAIACPLTASDLEQQGLPAAGIDGVWYLADGAQGEAVARLAGGGRVLSLGDVATDELRADPKPVGDPTRTCLLLPSSGTTSTHRKLISLKLDGLTRVVDNINKMVPVAEQAAEYLMSSPAHAFGLGRWLATLTRGGTLVLDEGPFNPMRTLLALDQHCCDALTGAASNFAVLLANFADHLAESGRSLRWIEMSSVPLARELKHRLLEMLPNTRIVMGYGLTEAMRCAMIDYRTDPDKIDSVGKPVAGVEMAVLDEAGEKLGPCRAGQLVVRGSNLAAGYWRQDDRWREKFTGNWLSTGDHGWIDQQGFVFVEGRVDDVINVGGIKVLPDEVEAVANALTGRPCALIGVPDPLEQLGEVPVLFIEGSGISQSPSAEELTSALRDRLVTAQIPRAIYFVEALPRTPNGKVRRRDLKTIGHARSGHSKLS